MRAILDIAAYLAQRLMRVLGWVASHFVVVLLVLTVSVGSAVLTATSSLVFNAASFAAQKVIHSATPNRREPTTVRGRVDAERRVDKIIRDAEVEALQAESRAARARAQTLETSLRQSETRLAEVTNDLRRSETRLAEVGGELERANADRRTLSATVADRDREIARLNESRVIAYRGRQTTAAGAAADTADRLRRRAGIAVGRNVGAMFGEAIPFYGVAVIAAATAWEVKDMCDMMGDIYALEVALNPSVAVPPDRTEACGIQVPTTAEIWSEIKRSPGAVWAKTKRVYSNLPDFSEFLYSVTVEPAMASWDWMFGDGRDE